jgi:hypothetical protein
MTTEGAQLFFVSAIFDAVVLLIDLEDAAFDFAYNGNLSLKRAATTSGNPHPETRIHLLILSRIQRY